MNTDRRVEAGERTLFVASLVGDVGMYLTLAGALYLLINPESRALPASPQLLKEAALPMAVIGTGLLLNVVSIVGRLDGLGQLDKVSPALARRYASRLMSP